MSKADVVRRALRGRAITIPSAEGKGVSMESRRAAVAALRRHQQREVPMNTRDRLRAALAPWERRLAFFPTDDVITDVLGVLGDAWDPPKVEGRCPMGCGESLVLLMDGVIVCMNDTCPEPRSVHMLISDAVRHHFVTLTESGFQIEHPLHERLLDGLSSCALHKRLSAVKEDLLDEHPPGKYPVYEIDGSWAWGDRQ